MSTAAYQARWRAKVGRAGRCTSCGRDRLPELLRCAYCLAADLERPLSHMRHDRDAHAQMLVLSHGEGSCAATGLSRAALRELGDRLTVDRVQNHRGYLPGNMQLLSGWLNRYKAGGSTVPGWAVADLLRRQRERLADLAEALAIQDQLAEDARREMAMLERLRVARAR